MLGTFSNDQPLIAIEVSGVSGIKKKLIALVDSGFNGYLQLPFVEALPLGLVLAGVQPSTLADGSVSSHLVCKGSVCLDRKCLDTTIDISTATIVLLGTKLLKELGKTFILNCASGKVEIVENEMKRGLAK